MDRDELGLRMLCAFNNVPRDQIPKAWENLPHYNVWTRDAWGRVAEAARAYLTETPGD